MKIPRSRLLLYVGLLVIALAVMLMLARSMRSSAGAEPKADRDYAQIVQEGKLRLLIPYKENAEQGQDKPQSVRQAYKLSTLLSRRAGLQVELIHKASYAQALALLQSGEVDAIAGGYIHNSSQDTTLVLPVALRQAKPLYLVQRAGADALASQMDLSGITIHIPRSRAWSIYLEHLIEELSVPIHITQRDDADVAQLMQAVASGKIDYTLATQDEAQHYLSTMDSLEARLPLTLSLRQGWLVRRSSPILRDSLEHWLTSLPN